MYLQRITYNVQLKWLKVGKVEEVEEVKEPSPLTGVLTTYNLQHITYNI